MKKLILLFITTTTGILSFGQTDTCKNCPTADTITIGNILIIKKHNKNSKNKDSVTTDIQMGRNTKERKEASKVSTNWWIMDFGFSNYSDQTNYANTGSYLVNRPGSPAFSKDDFNLRTGKSINVNIWFFMQKLALIKQNVNLKYGLGIELNNYRYKSDISYKERGMIPYSNGLQTNSPFIFRDSITFSKNKLAADYLTVPIMLNFASTPTNDKKGISLSLGVSGGYLYSQRNKQKSKERGKERNKGDYDLERFKFSYIAELGLGPVKLYGSYSPKSMYSHSLNIKPFTIGIRLSK